MATFLQSVFSFVSLSVVAHLVTARVLMAGIWGPIYEYWLIGEFSYYRIFQVLLNIAFLAWRFSFNSESRPYIHFLNAAYISAFILICMHKIIYSYLIGIKDENIDRNSYLTWIATTISIVGFAFLKIHGNWTSLISSFGHSQVSTSDRLADPEESTVDIAITAEQGLDDNWGLYLGDQLIEMHMQIAGTTSDVEEMLENNVEVHRSLKEGLGRIFDENSGIDGSNHEVVFI